jgi:hypothetical protein
MGMGSMRFRIFASLDRRVECDVASLPAVEGLLLGIVLSESIWAGLVWGILHAGL